MTTPQGQAVKSSSQTELNSPTKVNTPAQATDLSPRDLRNNERYNQALKLADDFFADKDPSGKDKGFKTFTFNKWENYEQAERRIARASDPQREELLALWNKSRANPGESAANNKLVDESFSRLLKQYDKNYQIKLAEVAKTAAIDTTTDPKVRYATSRKAEELNVNRINLLLGANRNDASNIVEDVLQLKSAVPVTFRANERAFDSVTRDKAFAGLSPDTIKTVKELYEKEQNPFVRQQVRAALHDAITITSLREAPINLAGGRIEPVRTARYLQLLKAVNESEAEKDEVLKAKYPSGVKEILRAQNTRVAGQEMVIANFVGAEGQTKSALDHARIATEAAKKVYFDQRDAASANLYLTAKAIEVRHLEARNAAKGEDWTTRNIRKLNEEADGIQSEYAKKFPKDTATLAVFEDKAYEGKLLYSKAIVKVADPGFVEGSGTWEKHGRYELWNAAQGEPKTEAQARFKKTAKAFIESVDKGNLFSAPLDILAMYNAPDLEDKAKYAAGGALLGAAYGAANGARGGVGGIIAGAGVGVLLSQVVSGAVNAGSNGSVIDGYTTKKYDLEFALGTLAMAADLWGAGTAVKALATTEFRLASGLVPLVDKSKAALQPVMQKVAAANGRFKDGLELMAQRMNPNKLVTPEGFEFDLSNNVITSKNPGRGGVGVGGRDGMGQVYMMSAMNDGQQANGPLRGKDDGVGGGGGTPPNGSPANGPDPKPQKFKYNAAMERYSKLEGQLDKIKEPDALRAAKQRLEDLGVPKEKPYRTKKQPNPDDLPAGTKIVEVDDGAGQIEYEITKPKMDDIIRYRRAREAVNPGSKTAESEAQIARWRRQSEQTDAQHVELKRANEKREELTGSANKETKRANEKREELTGDGNKETKRANEKREELTGDANKETKRANEAREKVADRTAGAAEKQANVAEKRYEMDVNSTLGRDTLNENARHNRVTESQNAPWKKFISNPFVTVPATVTAIVGLRAWRENGPEAGLKAVDNVLSIPESLAKEVAAKAQTAVQELEQARMKTQNLYSAEKEGWLSTQRNAYLTSFTQDRYDSLTTAIIEEAATIRGASLDTTTISIETLAQATKRFNGLMSIRRDFLIEGAKAGFTPKPRFNFYSNREGAFFWLWENQDKSDTKNIPLLKFPVSIDNAAFGQDKVIEDFFKK